MCMMWGITLDSNTICKRVNCPEIRRPIRMTKTSLKGKQSFHKNVYLSKSHEGSESDCKSSHNNDAQLYNVEDLWSPRWTETVGS